MAQIRKVDNYLSSSAMRATSSSMALASSVLGFDIFEIWSEIEPGKLHCTYVHAEERMKKMYPDIITGHYPAHKREHKLSPLLCELAKKSPNRCHWRILESIPSSPAYSQLAFPLKTEMAYQLELMPEYASAASSFIVAFSIEEVHFKPAKLKFLSGLAVAIFVAAFDLDEEPTEHEGSQELDVKKFEPMRPHLSSVNLAAMDLAPLPLPLPPPSSSPGMHRYIEQQDGWEVGGGEGSERGGGIVGVTRMRRLSSSESEPSTARDGDETPRFPHQREQASLPRLTLHATVPTWNPASSFSFPIAQIPIKYPIYDQLTFQSFQDVVHISDGSNANIFLGKLVGGKERVVIKMIKESVESDPTAIQEFDLEYGTLARISHPHIIRVLGAGVQPRRFIVLEHLAGGSLNTMLMQNQQTSSATLSQKLFRKPTFTYANLLQTARAMAEAMDYLHSRAHPGATFIHRDLKPDNVGFAKDGCLKLFDFGLVTCVQTRSNPNDVYEMTGYTGSLRYMAPEVVLRQPYSEKADVYSFGIMLWQMARDRVPFKGYNKEEFFSRVVHGHERPKLDKSWPTGFSNLLKSCWDSDALKRPSFCMIIGELARLQSSGGGVMMNAAGEINSPSSAPLSPSNMEDKRRSRPVMLGGKSSWF